MEYQVCKICVLDNSVPGVEFNERGQCHACISALARKEKEWDWTQNGLNRLDQFIKQIKIDGASKSHDCIIGLSGGLDSAYLALFLRERYQNVTTYDNHM